MGGSFERNILGVRFGERTGERLGESLGEWIYASSMHQECLNQASFILQANPSMRQEWFNLSQLPSPDEGLVYPVPLSTIWSLGVNFQFKIYVQRKNINKTSTNGENVGN